MTQDSVEVELVELGPDAASVRDLGLDPVGNHWVGAFADDRLIGAAGWSGAHLGPVLVLPEWRGQGLGGALLAAVEELAGRTDRAITAEASDEACAGWLRGLGYAGEGLLLTRRLPVLLDVPTAEAMQALGAGLGRLLRAGDVVILTGDLGAGKTTLTQGIGLGLGITEAITSPTFVLSRIHQGVDGPDLVHVDAYRLRGDDDDAQGLNGDEVDDIDLDSDLDQSVTVIEWGAGVAEQLSDDRLEIDIRRSDDPADEAREVVLRAVGARWIAVDFPGNGDWR